MFRFALGLVGLGVLPLLASAADVASDCVRIGDDRSRLACYDEAYGRAVAADATAPRVALPVHAEGSFGLSAIQRRGVEEAPTEIVATVSAVESHSHVGRWVVTLDNGQVWEQRETTPQARRPRIGDKVTIREAALGSYLLLAPNRGSNRVKRVR